MPVSGAISHDVMDGVIDDYVCEPTEPVHVLDVHGTDDDIILWAGGTLGILGIKYPSVEYTVREWADLNGCPLCGVGSIYFL